jgi:hypothetical protein
MLEKLLLLFYHLQPWFAPLIVCVLVIKLFLFVVFNNGRWQVSQYFYYRSAQIVSSSSFDKVTVKIIQNCLSFYALFLLVVYVAVKLIL